MSEILDSSLMVDDGVRISDRRRKLMKCFVCKEDHEIRVKIITKPDEEGYPVARRTHNYVGACMNEKCFRYSPSIPDSWEAISINELKII